MPGIFTESPELGVPTILSYDPTARTYVVGNKALELALAGRPAVQEFKSFIAESDQYFEGKATAIRGGKPERRWAIRPELAGGAGWVSTRAVVGQFFDLLFKQMGKVPEQLVIGVPANLNEEWQRIYRSHISSVLAELGLGRPIFFYEPFAVFQYYRHKEKLIPQIGQSLRVLIFDLGGGTLDCCVIETTKEGNLSRGGGTNVPIGAQSVQVAGKDVDKKLLQLGVGRQRDPRLRQESVLGRAQSKPYILLAVEQMKIELANALADASWEADHSDVTVTRHIAAGMYHPEVSFDLTLTGEDLKSAIKGLWWGSWGETVLRTIKEAKFRKGVPLQRK